MISKPAKILLILFILIFSIVMIITGFNLLQLTKKKNTTTVTNIDKNKIIEQLTTETQISYLKNLLNDPVFINYSEDRKTKEHIFVDKDFYVQIITNTDDKVLSYAVTARNKSITLGINSRGKEEGSLGDKTIAEISDDQYKPLECYAFLSGATANSYYFEKYYFGNPGHYQNYLYGFNDAGYFSISNENFFLSTNIYLESGRADCKKIPAEFRKSLLINTYMVIAPFVDFNDLEIDFRNRFIGANRIQVRLLKDHE